jgi:hypothetical protein
MAIELDQFIVPCRNQIAFAGLLADLLGVPLEQTTPGAISAVYIDDGLTLDFQQVSLFESALPKDGLQIDCTGCVREHPFQA